MSSIRDALAAAVGEDQLFEGDAIEPRYHADMRRLPSPRPAFVVRPADADEVAAVLRAANAHKVSVTTQGGRTGVVGGAMAEPDGIVLSLERMNRILEIDPLAMTMTVEAGCVVQSVQEAAEAEDMLLPLDLGARGSATIGGTIGTNAGGVRVLRWGMMRDMVLGVEAVLPDGSIVSSLRKTIKDNAGYDWKQLLIGSEGTLGIVTRAVLRLRPAPRSTTTALLALGSFDGAIALLRRLERDMGGALSSFELMWDDFYTLITEVNRPKQAPPLPAGAPLYALIEALGSDPDEDKRRFEQVLMRCVEDGLASDAVIAQSGKDRDRLWAVREDLEGPLGSIWPIFAFDVSMAVGDMPAFNRAAADRVGALFPDARMVTYGHVGDGNLHLMVAVGRSDAEAEHLIDQAVFESVRAVGGSISAEHGIGTMKRDHIGYTRSPAEMRLMRTIKDAVDPNGILNPGKIFPLTEDAHHV